MKTQHRISKHEMKEDSFVTFAFRAQEYIQGHQQLLWVALGALAVAVAGGWFFMSASRRSSDEAATVLNQAFARVQQNDMTGAATIYEQVEKEFSGTPSAREAVFYLANLHFVQQKWPEAITGYQDYLKKYSSFDPGRNVAAHAAIGDAFQALHDDAHALENYDQALATNGADYLRPEIYVSAARSALELKKTDVATVYADKLYEHEGNSPAMSDMRALLALHGVHYVRGF